MAVGELESEILTVLWKKDKTTVREALQSLKEKRVLAYTTVMTVMDNLYKKGFLKREKIKKTYLALIYGKLGKRAGERGVIDLPIARSEKTPILRVARGKTRGELKEALTEYKIVKYFYKLGNPIPDFTLVEVYPKTGRTHQIRAHFKAIGHPVVCDKLYSPKNSCPNDLNRHFLHAYSLEFNLPSGSRIKLEAELPDDLRKVLQKLSQYDKNYYD